MKMKLFAYWSSLKGHVERCKIVLEVEAQR